MNGRPLRKRGDRFQRWVTGAVLLTAVWFPATVRSQSNEPAKLAIPNSDSPAASQSPASSDSGVIQAVGPTKPDGGIQQTSCSSCGAGLLGTPEPANLCIGCGGHSPCVPGHRPCDCCCDEHGGPCKCFFCGIYHCMCCPDPCYEPRWLAVADAAFFQDAARPVTQMKLRWDTAFNWKDPDRSEYFWARESTIRNQLEPGGPCAKRGIGKGPRCIASTVDIEELNYYMEAAAGAAGLFVEIPYLHIDPKEGGAVAALNATPDVNNGLICCPQSGFGDIKIGTKAMLMDCELMQITFQFKTFIPSGNFTTGLGTGHVSLEPSLLFGIKLTPTCYLQMQAAYWIPIGGDPLYQSNILHGHIALNKILWCPCRDFKIVGTMELNGWRVYQGAFTDPDLVAINPQDGKLSPVSQSASTVMISAGPGVRMVICDKVDLGVGTDFALTGTHWAEETIRVEFRWRF